jgi:hypothetical protein
VLFIPRVALSVALATASFLFLERPILRGRRILPVRPQITAGAVTAIILAFSLFITSTAPAAELDFSSQTKAFNRLNTEAARKAAAEGKSLPKEGIFGDSTALKLNYGLADSFRTTELALPVGGPATPGCGLVRNLEFKPIKGPVRTPPTECNWDVLWGKYFDSVTPATKPDFAVVNFGPWDVRPHRFPGEPTWYEPGDYAYNDALRKEILAATDYLTSKGVKVIWLTSVPVGKRARPDGELSDIAQHPEWTGWMNTVLRQTIAGHPQNAKVVDLAGWYATSHHRDREMRPDGTHFTEDAARQISDEWLADQIMAAYRDLKTKN